MARDTDERTTPDWLFKTLDNYFGFKLDAAATAENAKCKRYYTQEDDGLAYPWWPGPVFVNPPYSRGELARWVRKATNEAGINRAAIAMIVPGDFGTKWFRGIWTWTQYIWFLEGRVKFNGMKQSAKFPTAVALFVPFYIPRTPSFVREYGGKLIELRRGVDEGKGSEVNAG